MSDSTGAGQPPKLSPLLPSDPPKVGDFWLDARLTTAPSGTTYVAHDDAGTAAMVILLSEGAGADAGARDRFAGTVNQLHIDTVLARGGHGQDTGRLAGRFRDESEDPQLGDDSAVPWVALAYDGSPAAVAEADRILAEVGLSHLPSIGTPAGPDYRLPWLDQDRPGLTRLWPLPWPGRHDRTGWLSILASWLLMLLLCALAILIAILLFQHSTPQSPQAPVPTASSSPQSGSPSPASASPSKSSASPSPSKSSASPSPSKSSASPSPSKSSGSPSPGSASPSAGGSPTPNSKL